MDGTPLPRCNNDTFYASKLCPEAKRVNPSRALTGSEDCTNCKHTCEKDNCNTIDIQRGNRCYACTATVDAQGRPVGVGDSNCLDEDKLHQSMLIDCKSDEESLPS